METKIAREIDSQPRWLETFQHPQCNQACLEQVWLQKIVEDSVPIVA